MKFLTTAVVAGLAMLGGARAQEEPECAVKECGLPSTISPGQACDDITETLITSVAGMNYGDLFEITDSQIKFGNEEGDADVTFKFIFDSGGFNFCFGFCMADAIPAGELAAIMAGNPTAAERKAFSISCISQLGAVFDDVDLPMPGPAGGPAETEVRTVQGNKEVIFFLIPNDKGADFMANPDNFFAETGNSVRPSPLFSLPKANPGGCDQLVLYSDGVKSLFTWEDKQRVPGSPEGASDNDFSDLAFTVDVVLFPDQPNPCPSECFTGFSDYESAHTGVASYTGYTASYTSDGTTCACLDFSSK